MPPLSEQSKAPHPKDVRIVHLIGYTAAGIAKAVELGVPLQDIEPSQEQLDRFTQIVDDAAKIVSEGLPYSKSKGFFPFEGIPSVEKACNAIQQIHRIRQRDTTNVIPLEESTRDCLESFITVERQKRLKELFASGQYPRVLSTLRE